MDVSEDVYACTGCQRIFTAQRFLTRHENKCSKRIQQTRRISAAIRRQDSSVAQSGHSHQSARNESLPHFHSDTREGILAGLFSGMDNGPRPLKRARPLASSNSCYEESDNVSRAVASTSSNITLSVRHDEAEPPMLDRNDDNDHTNTISSSHEHFELEDDQPLPSKRMRVKTARAIAMMADDLPDGPGALLDDPTWEPPAPSPQATTPPPPPPEPLRIRIRRLVRTARNKFGVSRLYHGRPSAVPTQNLSGHSLVADDLLQPLDTADLNKPHSRRTVAEIIAPYPNISSFLFNRWHWSGAKKTKESRRVLLEEVFSHPDFQIDDVTSEDIDFNALDAKLAQNPGPGPTDQQTGWKTSKVRILVPTGKKQTHATKRAEEAARRRYLAVNFSESDSDECNDDNLPRAGRPFDVPNFHHRSLTHVIKETFSSTQAKEFHWHPFEESWNPPWDPSTSERVHCDLAGSQAFLQADHALQSSPKEIDCDLPRVIAAMSIYSDATQVAQFGQAKVWPIYVSFGNQSKYDRARPEKRGSHTIAFLPSLPDHFVDFVLMDSSGKVSAPLLAHCRRELFHGCWKILLDDDEFLYAYEHGIIIDCGDGIRRRVYPRIFLYSADYPEKVLIATIRDLGGCPCPRCTIPKFRFINMATETDMAERASLARYSDDRQQRKVAEARTLIYSQGYAVNSAHVEALLKEESLVPTENAFTSRLSQFGFDVHRTLVVDLMHEVELGVWKSLLQHLVRMMYSVGATTVYTFNSRFRQVAPFGRATIRKFANNVADLTRLAARDYEDILQCCIPCFEGLFPEPHNSTILDLLYIMCYWHSLAKLRMHTDSSLEVLRKATRLLGDSLRYFAIETCKHFNTVETDTEYQARQRVTAKKNVKVVTNSSSSGSALAPSAPASESTSTSAPPLPAPFAPMGGKRPKTFNMSTPKAHSLPDYANQIEQFGTTDGFSTVIGESRHRIVKQQNGRTNFNNAIPQIVKIDTREQVHDRMTRELEELQSSETATIATRNKPTEFSEDLLGQHYHISSTNERNKTFIPEFVNDHADDPAFKNFIPRLKAHLLARHQGLSSFSEEESTYTASDLEHHPLTLLVMIFGGIKTLSTLILGVENGEPTHPYWYARVIGIYHAHVYFLPSREPQKMEFLWVRWFGQDPDWKGGPSTLRLDRIGFVPCRDVDAFGFLDPSLVIRACHLIPAFTVGRSLRLLGPSFARDSLQDGDWENYYVMRHVDRDMTMRYLGLGVGHRQASDFPREHNNLKSSVSGPAYVELEVSISNATVDKGNDIEGDGDYNVEKNGEQSDLENEDFIEEIYDL